MRRYLIFILFLGFSFVITAQSSFGIKVNSGISKISTNDYPEPFGTQKTYFMPSGQAGFFYNQPVRAHEFFGVELLYNQVQGKEKDVDTVGWYGSRNKNTALIATNTLTRNISYLSLPVYYGITVKKFTFKVGLQVSV